ncbi:hypothetical protein [Enterococcus casseliflavus]|uniref:hypothetical protein n=1 Tax=Enterococcus casseliflavus TaxID=37734 RepID=UPI00033138F3|nr:hypothetical protein [Enterococcus casseliflavus]EOH79760.1 hypothetical protein UAM_02493 [Enterococcus casseliflavus ATCC 49996]EOU09232.1 hypothetical protein I582_02397 [Enterococcus casseliflavus ATCC 49996]QQB85636.1 hypothetical protein I6H55_00430 [Enterococcus casseliflavus]
MMKQQNETKKSNQLKQDELIKMLTQLREDKDMDTIAELFWKIITAYGLKVDELGALNYYMMKRSLEAPVNSTFIKERMNLDVTQLGVDGILQVQRALVNVYVEQLAKEK